MKRNIALLLVLLVATSCASKTEFGDCVGLSDEQKPELIYKTSVRNVVIGAVFFQTIFTPILVGMNQFYCPVGRK